MLYVVTKITIVEHAYADIWTLIQIYRQTQVDMFMYMLCMITMNTYTLIYGHNKA